jgi:hypothetical protein
MTWIQTLEGLPFDVLEPNVNCINKLTIAEVLAKTCRFKGHCKGFYSVADHSLLVERLIQTPELKLPGLLHDSHELYSGFGDLASPVKRLNKEVTNYISNIEKNIDKKIAEKFGFDPELFYHPEVKKADLLALSIERKYLMEKCERDWLVPEYTGDIILKPNYNINYIEIAEKFLNRLDELL